MSLRALAVCALIVVLWVACMWLIMAERRLVARLHGKDSQ
jgi:hypothetical protein